MQVLNPARQHQARNSCVHSSTGTQLLSCSGRRTPFRSAAQTALHVATNGRSNRYQGPYPSRRVERRCVAPPEVPLVPLVLQTQPGLSDLVTVNTGPLETIVWKVRPNLQHCSIMHNHRVANSVYLHASRTLQLSPARQSNACKSLRTACRCYQISQGSKTRMYKFSSRHSQAPLRRCCSQRHKCTASGVKQQAVKQPLYSVD